MDASARRSSSRIPSFVALTVLACISFIAFTSVTSENRSFIRHERRSVEISGDGAPSLSANISNSTVSSVGPASPGIGSSSAALSFSSLSSLFSSSSTTSSLLPPTTTRLTTSSHTSFVSSLISPTSQSQFSTSTPSVVTTPSLSQSAQSSSRTTISPLQLITKVPTSSLTTSVDPLNGIPSTTLTFLDNFSPTVSTSVELPASPTTSIHGSSAANLSTSFWQKKGAVAAVFVIVSLVIVAVIAILVFFFQKRRSVRRRELMNDEMFEQFSEQDHRSSSPGPSINGAPMDPFASTEMVYDATSRTQPIHSYIPPSQTQHHLLTVPSYPVQHPDYYGNQPTTSQQSTASRLDSTPRQLVGTSSPALRTTGARGSYQQSLDSFYGVAGQ